MVIMFDLNNLCSLCLAQKKVFTSRSSIDSNAEDMIQRIIPEFVQQPSGIQRKICTDCLGSLTAVVEFRRKCLENIITFDEYLRKLQSGYGSDKYSTVTIADIKLDIKKEIDENIILDKDTSFLEDDVRMRTDCLQVEDKIKQENSYNRESNEEQEGNEEKSDFLDIKKEISEDIILDEDTKSHIVLIDSYKSDTEKTDEPDIQDIDCDESFKCSDCGEECSNRMHDIDSPKCQKCQTISTRNKSKNVRSAKQPYACSTCDKSFGWISVLKRHEVVHTGEKPFSCDLCEKRFPRLESLKVHQQLVHSSERPYVCNICQKTFATARTLRQHSLSHSDKRSFECNVCHKSFKRTVDLNRHNIIHTGVKRFECEICQKRFSRRDYLNLHKRVHSRKRPF